MKKALCILLSFVLLLCTLCACGNNGEIAHNEENTTDENNSVTSVLTPSAEIKSNLILPYSKADTLNPFSCKTQINGNLITLLYDGLYDVSDALEPTQVIAESAKVSSDEAIVKIKENVKFSDGSTLCAEDVVYSFFMAKESDNYSALLNDVSLATAVDNETVNFTLSNPDKYVLSVLTFPIIKSYSGEEAVPLGSGRYFIKNKKLTYNKKHILGEKTKISEIELFDLTDSTKDIDYLQIGNISVSFRDLSDCKIQRATSQSIPVKLTNLVFLGINSKKGALRDEKLRKAINMAIDKTQIADDCFRNYAVATETPFYPSWYALSEKIKTAYNQSGAVTELDKSGYSYQTTEDRYRSSKDGSLVLNIVTQKSTFMKNTAEKIQQMLSEVGVEAKVTQLSKKEYKNAVKSNDFDLYIGEVKLCENMNLRAFISGSARYAISTSLNFKKAYNSLLSDNMSADEFLTVFQSELPFIPLVFREGILYASNGLEDNIKPVANDIYANITKWRFAD